MDPAPTRVLLVEDDRRILHKVGDGLTERGFRVDTARSIAEATAKLGSHIDLMLLDLTLPDGDGLDFCDDLRREGASVPIIILSARDAPDQRVRGLYKGADDYMVKPFHLPELAARIRTVLRRSGQHVGIARVESHGLWAEPANRVAGIGDSELNLSPREFDLLLFLLRNPGRTWTREQLLEGVWGADFDGDARTVDSHIRRLRSRIEADAGDPKRIQTVWGVGYRLSGDP